MLLVTNLTELSSLLFLSIAVPSIQGRLGSGLVSCLDPIFHFLNTHQNFQLWIGSSFLLRSLESAQAPLVPRILVSLGASFLWLPPCIAIHVHPIRVGVNTVKFFILLCFSCRSLSFFLIIAEHVYRAVVAIDIKRLDVFRWIFPLWAYLFSWCIRWFNQYG